MINEFIKILKSLLFNTQVYKLFFLLFVIIACSKKDDETEVLGTVTDFYTSDPLSNFPVFIYRDINEYSDEFAYDFRFENYGMSALSSISSPLLYEDKFYNIIDTIKTDQWGNFYKVFNFKSSGNYEAFVLLNGYISVDCVNIDVGKSNRIDLKVKRFKTAKFDFNYQVPGTSLKMNLYYNIGNGKILRHLNIQNSAIDTVVYYPIIPDADYYAQIYISSANYGETSFYFDTLIKGYCYPYNETTTFNIKNN